MRLSLPLRRPVRWGAGLVVLLVAALAALPGTARAEVILNETLPFAGSLFNECNGQEVVFDDGRQHLVISFTFSNGGMFVSDSQSNIEATGFDVLMRKYQLSDTSTDMQKVWIAKGEQTTMIFNHTLIGPEQNDNAYVRARYVVAVDAFGVPSVRQERLETYCR